jgi:hypothetical protein
LKVWVAGLLVSLAGCSNAFERRVEDVVRGQLKDPDSAKFSEVEYFESRQIACGKVNAKNSFGGYVGAIPFAYFDGKAFSLEWGNDPNRYLWVQHQCLVEHISVLRKNNPGVMFEDPSPFKPVR